LTDAAGSSRSPAAGARRAFVLGGGVAGLVAAFGLAERGFAVELLESRAHVGGRAFASPDRAFGTLDNGFHVMLGCYRAMRALLLRLGTEGDFQQDRSLQMSYRFADGRRAALSLSRLPVPIAMPWSLLRMNVPFGARLRALRAMSTVLLGARAHETLADWLLRRGQQGLPDAVMWRPLCRAVMNVEPEEASARGFLATLREAFMGRASSAAFWVPKKTWGELIGDPAPRALAAAGVTLTTGARVVALPRDAGSVAAIELGNGERRDVGADDVVVSALPWFALKKLVDVGGHDFGALSSSPIVTAYFELPEDATPPMDEGPVVALVDAAPFHFLLRTPGADARRFALLSGGDRSFDGQKVAEIEAIARAALQRYYPDASANAGTVRVRKEQLATFVDAPGSDALRPPPGKLPGGPHNLHVCGDWTATGFPATLEGAARSAESMLAQLATAKTSSAAQPVQSKNGARQQ